MKILIPIPSRDFDPTEVAIPWSVLRASGHVVTFSTPDGQTASADELMVTGKGLGILAPMLRANGNALNAYRDLKNSEEFNAPMSYGLIDVRNFDAIVLPGGHAKGMKTYLESQILQQKVAQFFSENKPVGAICHGVVLAARSGGIKNKVTTALPKWMELNAWAMTCLWLKDYYRTYSETVQDEVTKNCREFRGGPFSLNRDDLEHLERGFVVKDGNYISARWPGDARLFATEFLRMLS
jgi:protease I